MLGNEFDDVLGAAQAGADWAWARLFDELAGQVLGYARSQGSRDPEDVVSEVFLQIARNVSTFEGTENGFRSWVFTVAHSRLIDERRRLGRRPSEPVADIDDLVPPQPDLTSEEAVETLQTERLRRLMHRLVPSQRDVLLLRIVLDLSVSEVAGLMGKSEGAIKALQRRALLALSDHLESEGIPR